MEADIAYWPWWMGALALGLITLGFRFLVGSPLGVSGSWARVVHWRKERAIEAAEADLPAELSAEQLQAALMAATLAHFDNGPNGPSDPQEPAQAPSPFSDGPHEEDRAEEAPKSIPHTKYDSDPDNNLPNDTSPPPNNLPTEARPPHTHAAQTPAQPHSASPDVSSTMNATGSKSDTQAQSFVLQRRTSWAVHGTLLLGLTLGGTLSGLSQGTLAVQMNLGDLFTAISGDGVTASMVLIFGGILVGFGTQMAGGCTSGHGLSGCSRLQPGSMLGTCAFFGAAVATSFLLDFLR